MEHRQPNGRDAQNEDDGAELSLGGSEVSRQICADPEVQAERAQKRVASIQKSRANENQKRQEQRVQQALDPGVQAERARKMAASIQKKRAKEKQKRQEQRVQRDADACRTRSMHNINIDASCKSLGLV